MDVVWLKKDVRINDHAPLSSLSKSNRKCMILYLYEPDQLGEPCVHGSHINFINEGLVDLDLRLQNNTTNEDITAITNNIEKILRYEFKCITICYTGVVFALNTIHTRIHPIHEILCHMETTHLKAYARDRAVRRWCKSNNVTIHEYNQTGVTRCLNDRDCFSKNLNAFFESPMPDVPTSEELDRIRSRLVVNKLDALYGRCSRPMKLCDIKEIPEMHRVDRIDRQCGGETKALETLKSFLTNRGNKYSSGISSPNTCWSTGSRLSPFITWGHISLRYVISCTNKRINELRVRDKKIKSDNNKYDTAAGIWIRSLSAFLSRCHWRSHFTQKLESEPDIQKHDQCISFSHLRRQPGDYNSDYFIAWCSGHTGFPYVDACMRCLIRHGWLNFRMRAMLVSFATYNLWLDWKIIAPHLARVFLDYEPGIHYPQLQMQAGVTGINAMRVYNVTKQGKDQDPKGIFIRKYVDELKNIPLQYIHEPSKMSNHAQMQCGIRIVDKIVDGNGTNNRTLPIKEQNKVCYYPMPIVDEVQSAKVAKDKIGAVRKLEATKCVAQQVFEKHGSRTFNGQDRDGRKPKALSSTVKRVKIDSSQPSIKSFLSQQHDTTTATTTTTTTSTTTTESNSNVHEKDMTCHRLPASSSEKQASSRQNKKSGQNLRLKFDDENGIAKQNKNNLITNENKISNLTETKDVIIVDEIDAETNYLIINDDVASNLVTTKEIFIEDDILEKESSFDQFDNCKHFMNKNKLQIEKGADECSTTSNNKNIPSLSSSWSCQTCTFLNDKPIALSCSMCGTIRKSCG